MSDDETVIEIPPDADLDMLISALKSQLPTRSGKPRRKRWEYRVTSADIRTMNEMGDDGWEAVSTISGGYGINIYWKREKL